MAQTGGAVYGDDRVEAVELPGEKCSLTRGEAGRRLLKLDLREGLR